MQRILAMHVAAQLTQAACGPVGGSLPISADLSDNNVRAKNLHVWETFRVFYHGVLSALGDPSSWPSPQIDLGEVLPGLVESLNGVLASGSPLAQFVQQILATLPKTGAVPSDRLPNPGQTS